MSKKNTLEDFKKILHDFHKKPKKGSLLTVPFRGDVIIMSGYPKHVGKHTKRGPAVNFAVFIPNAFGLEVKNNTYYVKLSKELEASIKEASYRRNQKKTKDINFLINNPNHIRDHPTIQAILKEFRKDTPEYVKQRLMQTPRQDATGMLLRQYTIVNACKQLLEIWKKDQRKVVIELLRIFKGMPNIDGALRKGGYLRESHIASGLTYILKQKEEGKDIEEYLKKHEKMLDQKNKEYDPRKFVDKICEEYKEHALLKQSVEYLRKAYIGDLISGREYAKKNNGELKKYIEKHETLLQQNPREFTDQLCKKYKEHRILRSAMTYLRKDYIANLIVGKEYAKKNNLQKYIKEHEDMLDKNKEEYNPREFTDQIYEKYKEHSSSLQKAMNYLNQNYIADLLHGKKYAEKNNEELKKYIEKHETLLQQNPREFTDQLCKKYKEHRILRSAMTYLRKDYIANLITGKKYAEKNNIQEYIEEHKTLLQQDPYKFTDQLCKKFTNYGSLRHAMRYFNLHNIRIIIDKKIEIGELKTPRKKEQVVEEVENQNS